MAGTQAVILDHELETCADNSEQQNLGPCWIHEAAVPIMKNLY